MSSNESFFAGRKKVLGNGVRFTLLLSLNPPLSLKGESGQRTNNAQATSKAVKKQDLTPRLLTPRLPDPAPSSHLRPSWSLIAGAW